MINLLKHFPMLLSWNNDVQIRLFITAAMLHHYYTWHTTLWGLVTFFFNLKIKEFQEKSTSPLDHQNKNKNNSNIKKWFTDQQSSTIQPPYTSNNELNVSYNSNHSLTNNVQKQYPIPNQVLLCSNDVPKNFVRYFAIHIEKTVWRNPPNWWEHIRRSNNIYIFCSIVHCYYLTSRF